MQTKNYRIAIPEPCHEDWNQMSPNAQGRFCSSCAKTVVDFTQMNKDEIAKHVAENDKVCGRISSSQLNTVYQIPYKERFKLARFAAACLLVFGLGLFNYSCEMESPHVNLVELTLQGKTIFTETDPEILGNIVNVDDSVFATPNKEDSIIPQEPELIKKGEFAFPEHVEGEVYITEIEECIIPDIEEEQPPSDDTTPTLTKEDIEHLPERDLYMVGAMVIVDSYKETIVEPDIIDNAMKLYPNPANQIVNFSFKPGKLEQREEIAIQIFSATGALVQNETLQLTGDTYSTAFTAADLNNGVYFINFVYNNERISQKLIVQQ